MAMYERFNATFSIMKNTRFLHGFEYHGSIVRKEIHMFVFRKYIFIYESCTYI